MTTEQYDASLGRYTQPDPIGLVAGPNRYLYANGSPLMWTDREGLLPGLGDLWDKLFPSKKPDACFLPDTGSG